MKRKVSNSVCADGVSMDAGGDQATRSTIFLGRGVNDGRAFMGEASEVAAILLGECLLDVSVPRAPMRSAMSKMWRRVHRRDALSLDGIKELERLVLTGGDEELALVVEAERAERPLGFVVSPEDLGYLEIGL